MVEIIRQVSPHDAEKLSMDKRIDSRAVLATVAALALGVTLIYSVTTSGAQFAASTNNSSNEFWAGQIDVSTNLVQPVLLVSDGIYPGIEIQECMDVSYVGTINGVSTRMYASAAEGGLGEFLNIEIEAPVWIWQFSGQPAGLFWRDPSMRQRYRRIALHFQTRPWGSLPFLNEFW